MAPREVPRIMLVPAIIQVSVIIAIGLMPAFFGAHVIDIIQTMLNNSSLEISEGAIHALTSISYANILLIGLTALIFIARAWQQSKVKVTVGPTWGCGYTAGDFRHQYTPTSYANSLRELVNPVVDYQAHYRKFQEDQIFPEKKEFHTETKDLVEEKTVLSWVHLMVNHLPKAGIAQSGLINHYLVYPMLFWLLIGFLIIINVL